MAITLVAANHYAAGAVGVKTNPTFNKEVAPILFKNCAKCHDAGEIASAVPLLAYDTARPWAKAIKEKVLLREMPPWPADPNSSLKFRNEARLSQKDIDTLVAWVDTGAARGDDSDLPLLTHPATQGWLHPEGRPPDVIVAPHGSFKIPADGEVPYIRFLSKVPFAEDRWVAASQVNPGNRAVVHHMAITELQRADRLNHAQLDTFALFAQHLGISNALSLTQPAVTSPSDPSAYDMLGVYTPGSTFEKYPDGTAKLLKGGKNLYLDFNIHYTTTGKPETDRSMMALWFQPKPPRHQLYRVPAAVDTIIAQGKELLADDSGEKAEGTSLAIPPIPPRADNYELIGMTAYTEPVTLYQLQPHAHVRCKDFKYAVVYPDGREQTVLRVPKYDFNWQLAYELETPLKLPAGSKLIVTAHYDNSARNDKNPNPEQAVHFRQMNQSWDEMFTPFIQYTIDSQDLTKAFDVAEPKQKRDQAVVEIVEVDGCLEENPAKTWVLNKASDPAISTMQGTTSEALESAKTNPPGIRRYELLGVRDFNPSIYKGQKVAIKGAMIQAGKQARINVTSLQPLGVQTRSGEPKKRTGS